MKINTLTIIGEETQPVKETNGLQPEACYKIGAGTRDAKGASVINIDAKNKLFEFVLEDGSTWMCDADTLHELFPEAETAKRSSGNGFMLPSAISGTGNERGILGKITIKLLNVFKKNAVQDTVANIAAKLEDHLLDKQEGLFRLGRDFTMERFDQKPSVKPFLLFIHGTNSNTQKAFGKLKGSELWNYIHDTYGSNVLAFQHRTLTKSPLKNVVELAKELPASAELHLISHSRGGLVGDIICRYALDGNNRATRFSNENIKLLRKEKRTKDLEDIETLNTHFGGKKIRVKKFIRVACPAAGTRLASKRLDTIMNTFINLLENITGTVGDILKELIAATLKTKDNVDVLPGIEAQNPESPFIKVLNDPSEEMAMDGGPLAVISGNSKASLSPKGIVVILGRLFFNQRNDLVVNTDSMYLGAGRKGHIHYFFDQGSDVDHFKYFLNNKTRQAIGFVLKAKENEPFQGFVKINQHEVPASDRGVFGLEHGELAPYENIPTGKKPILVLLPGIMGSNLENSKGKIWLNYIKALFGGLEDLDMNDTSVKATSLIKSSYDRLATRLSKNYDVVIYPFDWRKQLAESAAAFNTAIEQLLKLNQPIKIVGHSMGGVLVRDFIINHDETWQKLNTSKDFRLLFLGSPLGGSFRILTVLFGIDPIIRSLNMLDRKHSKKELLEIFSSFPGILSLLPLTTGKENDFASVATWKAMAEAYGDTEWPIPAAKALDEFGEYRENINKKSADIDYTNMVYIAGKDKYTPCAYYNDDIPPKTELVFLYTAEGDQSVTWESGIPQKMIDAGKVYYTNTTHGALANDPAIFDGIEEILKQGVTSLLNTKPPVERGRSMPFRMPDVFHFDFSTRGIENALLGITEEHERKASQVPVTVSVSNGDLAFATHPLLAGHFNRDGIMNAEKVIDRLLEGSLAARHELRLYPGPLGTNTVILANGSEYSFPGTIIIGLGDPGALTVHELAKTVEQGVCKYLLDINSLPDNKKETGLSTLIVGSDYGGLSIESSVKAIIEGVTNANSKVPESLDINARTVQHIEFIELYEDRALNCWYALNEIEKRENSAYNITLKKKIKSLFGSRKRLPLTNVNEWWNRFIVKLETPDIARVSAARLVFRSTTRDARVEEDEIYSNTKLINAFIENISTNDQWDAATAKALFELMIPNQFKENLKKKGDICWVLDEGAAAYPWELLQEDMEAKKPLCIGAGMIRQLITNEHRQNINRVSNDLALVIAEPDLEGFANPLPQAKTEGEKVSSLLNNNAFGNDLLVNRKADHIILTLFSKEFKIIHLAGHGVYDPADPSRSGMVIGNDLYLTTAEIKQMSAVPELVFVNCCFLGKMDAGDEKYKRDRYKLAANIGTQLINIGVRAVIAAGWAVADDGAAEFADEFYTCMLNGATFGDAVTSARNRLYNKNGSRNNTWGAYQCYGDPFYRLVNRSGGTKKNTRKYTIRDEAVIDLQNLRNNLDTRNINSKQAIDQLDQVARAVSEASSPINCGEITEQQAMIYYELGEYAEAEKKFEELRKEYSSVYSISSLEMHYNAMAKNALRLFKKGNSKTIPKAFKIAIDSLKMSLKVSETVNRYVLIGSALKRKAMCITTGAAAKLKEYNAAVEHYKKAVAISINNHIKDQQDKHRANTSGASTKKAQKKAPVKTGHNHFDGYKIEHYPLNNWLVLATAVGLADKTKKTDYVIVPRKDDRFTGPLKYATTAAIIADIEKRKQQIDFSYSNMDFWQLLEQQGYDFALLMIDQKRAENNEHWKNLEERYRNIWKHLGSKGKMIAETENFEIISDILSLSQKTHARHLKKKIDELRAALEKMLLESSAA